MSSRIGGVVGLLILLAGGAGLYLFSRQAPGGEEGATEAPPTVVPVEVSQVQRMTLHDYLWTYGSVIPDPGLGGSAPAAVRVSSPIESVVTQVTCSPGDRVTKGQVLFSLYDRPAQLAVEQAEAAAKFAEENLLRQEKLNQVQATSAKLLLEAQQQLDAAQSALNQARLELEWHTVRAPFDGTVMAVETTVGQTVPQGGPLAFLTDLSRLMVQAGIPSPQASKLQAGQEVAIAADDSALGASETAASTSRVDYVDKHIDATNDTVSVFIGLPSDATLRPGQLVRVRITAAEYKDQLVVPNVSVVTTPEGQTVVAIVQADEAVPIPVQRGVREGDYVAVEGSGIEPGMDVVTVGAYGLPGRTKIRIMDQQPAAE